MDASQKLKMKRREMVRNEVESLKLKRKSSSEKDVGSLRRKLCLDNLFKHDEDDFFTRDEDDDESKYVKGVEDGDLDNSDKADDDVEGSEEDAKGEDSETGDDGEVDEENSVRRVSYGYHFVEGKMAHPMEDYVVAKTRKMKGYDLGLFAIFDGHSGRDVAEYLQSHLFDWILSESDFWTNPKAAIKRAFRKADDEILENVVGARGGSTAVRAILINGKKLIVANVGDSRAISCRNGMAKQITVDHEPNKEKEVVESRGGFVSWKPGNVPRVDGQLAMTRAFGDEKVKEHITAEPDVFIENVDDDIDFVVLASDGLWKVMSNQDAVDCIKDVSDAKEAARELIKEALLRESRDDISCVVVMF